MLSPRVMSATPRIRSGERRIGSLHRTQPGDVLRLPQARADHRDQGGLRARQHAVALGVGQHHAPVDGPRVERGHVEDLAQHRVAGVEPGEAAVAAVAVHQVGADPAADPGRALQDAHDQARLLQRPCAGEPGDAGADHGHVRGVHGC